MDIFGQTTPHTTFVLSPSFYTTEPLRDGLKFTSTLETIKALNFTGKEYMVPFETTSKSAHKPAWLAVLWDESMESV